MRAVRDMVTIKDIAREVGLSVTTVSRALGDHDDVAEETKTRIRAVARALDYHPNLAARSLQTAQTSTLGLVIPSTLHRAYDPFWLEFIGGMAETCVEHGYDLSLSAADGPGEPAPAFRRWVHGRRVDGLVLCDIRNQDRRVAYLRRHHVPFVAFGRTLEPLDYAYIDVDGTAGVRQAMQHLTDLGHRRIAFLGVDGSFGFSRYRRSGYEDGLADAGLPVDSTLLHENLNEQTAIQTFLDLCKLPDPPTAVFAAAGALALAVLRAARTVGLRIPADLSLAVFDGSTLTQQATDPALTAVSQDNHQLGREAAAMLLLQIRAPGGPIVQRVVGPTLLVRSSTGPVPADLRPSSHIPAAATDESGRAYLGTEVPDTRADGDLIPSRIPTGGEAARERT